MEKYFLAADLGGTNLRLAVVSGSGEIIHRTKEPTPANGDRHQLIDTIRRIAQSCIEGVPNGSRIAAFGVAIPATVNSSEGIALRSPQLPELNGFAFAEHFAKELGVPVVLENDASAAAVGEQRFGASKGVRNCIHVTLGTGVGGGLIIEGKLYRGIDGTAGEIGHITVEPDGYPCGCGSRGCLEQYSSALGIKRHLAKLSAKFPASPLSSMGDVTPLMVYEQGLKGDKLALEVFRIFGTYLGIAVGGLVNVLNPEAIVFGGGVSAGWDLFVEPLRDEIFRRAFRHPAERVRLMRSELGDDAGIVGAAFLASEAVS